MKLRGIVALMAWGSFVQGYLYELKVMRAPGGRKQVYIIGCSDYHDKYHQANSEQRAELLSLIERNAGRVRLLVEDLSSPNTFGNHGCNPFLLTSNQGILASLTKDCQKRGVAVDNIEYRYCRVIAFGRMLAQPTASPFACQPACMTRMGCMYDEVMAMLRTIESFNDGPILNAWYKQTCNAVYKSLLDLQIPKLAGLSAAAYLEQQSKGRDRMALLKQLLTFDGGLFDCTLVHSIVNHKDSSVIMAVAGGTHIQRAFEQLARVGYEPVYNSEVSIHRDYDLQKNIGSQPQPGGFVLKPGPINLDKLKQYLN